MDPRHLHYLAEIIEQGSLTKAAERLNITQPTLSRILKTLETRAGSPLVVRGRFGVTPTEIGRRLMEQGKAISLYASKADDTLAHWRQGMEGELRLGVGPMLAATIMGDFLAGFVTKYVSYSLLVKATYSADLIESLREGALEAAVLPSKLTLHQMDLNQEVLFEDQLAVYASVDNPVANAKETMSQSKLEKVDWVETAPVSGLASNETDVLVRLGIDIKPARLKFSGDLQMAVQVVSRSNAMCVLPRKLVGRLAAANRLVEIPTNLDLPPRNIAFWTRQEKTHRPEILDFKARLIEHIDQLNLTKPNEDHAP